MLSSQTMPNDQEWLIKVMRSLGFKSAAAGVCFGVSCMAMQAILGEDIASFEARLWQIFNLANNITVDAMTLMDIKAFFHGVELFQQPELYNDFFESGAALNQNGVDSLTLTLSRKLEKEGGVYEALRFAGAYSLEDLTNYFSSLRASMDNEQAPLAFVLRSYSHAISVTYDAKNNEWLLLNISNGSFKKFKTTNEIAKAVHNALTASETAIFSTSVFSANKNKTTTTATLDKWKAKASFQSINAVNTAKTKLTDSNGDNLLMVAILQQNIALVKELLAHGANPNTGSQSNNMSPLHVAAYIGNADIAALLLQHGANKNAVDADNRSPLFVAAMQGHNNVIVELLKCKADIDVQSKSGATALYVAAYNNRAETTSLLLAQGANPNIGLTVNNLTPFATAVWNGNINVVKSMLTSGAAFDLNAQLSTDGRTPLMLAAEADPEKVKKSNQAAALKYKEVVTELLLAGASTQIKSKTKLCAAEMASLAGHREIALLIKKNIPKQSGLFSAVKNKLSPKPKTKMATIRAQA